jgi:hypothetical protein
VGRTPEALERRREYDRRRAKAKNKAYYEKNRERELQRCRAYHHEARDRRLEVKAQWRDANREPEREKARERYWSDPAASREYHRQWRLESNFADYAREWRKQNTEREKERLRLWAQENRGRMRAKCAARRARKNMATPAWADEAAIRAIYEECARLIDETGVRYEVDHIIPLKGETVCGLHVHQNLRIVTQLENRQKYTKLEPDCEDFWPPDHEGACVRRSSEGTQLS